MSHNKRWRLILSAAILLLPAKASLAYDDDPEPPPSLNQNAPAANASLKQFPQNLGRNFLALFSPKNIVPLLVGGAASGIVAPFDDEIRDHWSATGGSTTVGKVGSVLGGPAVVFPTVTALLIGGQYSKNDRFRSFSYALAQGAVINEGLVQGLKLAVGRTRPDGSDDRSFPSGHAAMSFMIASTLQRYYGWKVGVIGYSAATFIAFSRVRDNHHWASDITAGATLGYIVGSSVSRRTGISVRVKKVVLVPSFDLGNRRVGISFIGAGN